MLRAHLIRICLFRIFTWNRIQNCYQLIDTTWSIQFIQSIHVQIRREKFDLLSTVSCLFQKMLLSCQFNELELIVFKLSWTALITPKTLQNPFLYTSRWAKYLAGLPKIENFFKKNWISNREFRIKDLFCICPPSLLTKSHGVL